MTTTTILTDQIKEGPMSDIEELKRELEAAEVELADTEDAYLSLLSSPTEATEARKRWDEQQKVVEGLTRRVQSELGGGEWFDGKQGMWVSRAGYEVCQDHTGPRATCPYRHNGRRREQ